MNYDNNVINICIYDDNIEISEMLSYFFSSLGIKTFVASDLADCINMLRTKEISILFLDYNLYNVKCGLDLCNRFILEYPFLKIIMMSGDSDKDLISQAFKSGAVDFIRKPLYLGELKARFEKVAQTIPKQSYGGYYLSSDDRSILYNNSKIQLSSIEYKIISLLFENIGVYIPRENLIEQINQTGKSRVLDVHLSNLRKKVIGINIKTKAKFGYGLFIERS